MARVLLVLPYAGEFGWELMNWQGRVRYLARHGGFERVIVAAAPGRRALYEGSGIEFRAVMVPALPGTANEDHRIFDDGTRLPAERIREPMERAVEGISAAAGEFEILCPPLDGRLWPTTTQWQMFCELRRQRPLATDVVLVDRRRSSAVERNLSEAWWDELDEALSRKGLRVERYAHDVSSAIEQLSGARLAIGGSTGGLHLASLCRCPHYVWGCDSSHRWTALRMSNRQRYQTFWNPLGTPVVYDECGWTPSVGHVVDQTLSALGRIGLSRETKPAPSVKWRVKRGLARIVENKRGWPWKVRRLVHEALV